MKKIYAFMLVLILLLLCTGCSSEKPEDIRYNIAMRVQPYIHTTSELLDESSHIFEGVVIDISAQVHHRKTGKPVIFSIGSDDPYDYCVVTVYQVLVTQPYKGMTGIVETVVSGIGNWYEMGPARKKELERVGIEPHKLLVDYGLSVGLEKGSSYLFFVSESENGYMTPLDYWIGWDTDWEATTKIKERLSPMMPPLLTLGIIVVVLAAVAAVTTVLIIRKKKRKATPEETEQILEET